MIMKVLLISILLVLYAHCANRANDNESCVTCIKDDTKKLCKPDPERSDLFCCNQDEFSVDCGSGTFGKCSDTYKNLGKFGEYLLCPNHNDCGSDEYNINSHYTHDITTRGVPGNGVCVINLINDQYHSEGLTLETNIQRNVDVQVFMKMRNKDEYYDMGEFEMQDGSNDGLTSKIDYDIDYPNSAVFVVVPKNNQVGGFAAKAISFEYEEDDPISRGLPAGAIIGIVCGSLWIVLMFTLIIICCCRKRRAKARMQQFYRECAYQKIDEEATISDHEETGEQMNTNSPMDHPLIPPQHQQPNENMMNAYPTIETGVPIYHDDGAPLNPNDGMLPTKNGKMGDIPSKEDGQMDPSAPAKKV